MRNECDYGDPMFRDASQHLAATHTTPQLYAAATHYGLDMGDAATMTKLELADYIVSKMDNLTYYRLQKQLAWAHHDAMKACVKRIKRQALIDSIKRLFTIGRPHCACPCGCPTRHIEYRVCKACWRGEHWRP
jgi:hypothetical protein